MPAINKYGYRAKNVSSPADDVFLVTPSDTDDLTYITKAIRLSATGTSGNVVIITEAGNQRTIPMLAGEQWDVSVRRIMATGTTATGIYAFV